MSYIKETLSNEEKILLTPDLHWFNYVKPVYTFLTSFFALGFIFYGFARVENYISPILAVLIAFMITFLFLLIQIIGVRFIELACTNKRVVSKKGIFVRDAEELQLTKVESVEVKQFLLGRIFGFGNVHFSGTGTSNVVFKTIKNPLQIKAQATDIIHDLQN